MNDRLWSASQGYFNKRILITHKCIKVQKVPETAKCIFKSMVNRRYCKAFQVKMKKMIPSTLHAVILLKRVHLVILFLYTISS